MTGVTDPPRSPMRPTDRRVAAVHGTVR
ncbi:hypothetical protein ACTIVE_0465 [Actinomadura verrucosospora]|uniref:Uncharacterized protein n=1 Tax=Actinomadura verrucosospora TaxID=46165 RepID=A0A7D4AKG8_ACTVE|nr:hypothetical protein ACTIVE_0465 [Actinomadura verrucosospora]